ncbi:MAG: hypothetical protein RIC85_03955 [Gammaproteobacteria bacterium]
MIRVKDWASYYGFRISDPKSSFDIGPFSDLITLTFSGDLIEPENFKYKKAELTLSAHNDLVEGQWTELPTSIGSLSANEDTLSAYVFVPTEHMVMLMWLANSGKVQTASMVGTRLRYRSGNVQNISLDTSPEDKIE